MTERGVERGVNAVLLVLGLGYLAVMLSYPSRAGLVPAIVAVVMVLAVIVDLVRPGDDVDEGEGVLARVRGERGRRFVVVGAWSVLLFVLLQVTGFTIGAGIGLLAFLLHAGERPLPAVALAVGTAAGVYGLMDRLLGVPTLTGPLLSWL